MSLFSIIGHFFSDLFNASKKAWDKLPSSTQAGLLNGSGIINIINVGINADPKVVAATIEQQYPSEPYIYSGLLSVAKSWGIVGADTPANLPALIALIQKYLKGLEASEWPAIVSGAAGLLASILSGDTPFEIISSLLQFVYSTFIKPKTVTLIQINESVPTAGPLAVAEVETVPNLTNVAANLGNQALGSTVGATPAPTN